MPASSEQILFISESGVQNLSSPGNVKIQYHSLNFQSKFSFILSARTSGPSYHVSSPLKLLPGGRSQDGGGIGWVITFSSSSSPGWMHETSARTWCSGRTWRERVQREVRGGIGMGKTCKLKDVSFQCMTKFTTKKKKEKKIQVHSCMCKNIQN